MRDGLLSWLRVRGRCGSSGPRDPWFCLPVVFCMVLDAGVSLACQPGSYWADPSSVQEGNSAWEALLARGPLAFIAGFLLYVVVMAAVLWWLTGALQKLLGMWLLLAHSYGAASWCHVGLSDEAYWWTLVGMLLAEAIVFAAYWHLSPACGNGGMSIGPPDD